MHDNFVNSTKLKFSHHTKYTSYEEELTLILPNYNKFKCLNHSLFKQVI